MSPSRLCDRYILCAPTLHVHGNTSAAGVAAQGGAELKRHEKELFRRWEQMQEWRKERS
jgi:hypothetical protein